MKYSFSELKKCYFIWLILLMPLSSIWGQGTELDSLKNSLSKVEEKQKSLLYYSISSQFLKHNFDSSLFYAEKAIAFAQKQKHSLDEANALKAKGVALYYQGKHDLAAQNYLKALQICDQADTKIYTEKEIKQAQLQILNELAVLENKQGNTEQAITHLEKAIKYAQQINDKEGLANGMNNLGTVLSKKGDKKTALKYFQQSADIKRELGDKYGLSYNLNNISEILLEEGRYQEAAQMVEEALEIRKYFADRQGIAICINNIGEIWLAKGDYKRARGYFFTSVDTATAIGFLDLKKYSLEQIAICFQKENNFEKSLEFYQKSSKIKDLIFNEKKAKQIAELEAKYESEKKEKEIIKANLALKNSQIQNQKQQYQIIALLVFMIFGALILFVLYKNHRIKEKTKVQKILILEQERGLKAVFHATETERKRIAKDLHDGVGQLLSVLKMAWQNLAEEILETNPKQSQTLDKLSKNIDKVASDVRTISHQMMPRTLSEFGLVAAIRENLDKTLSFTKIQYDFEHHRIEDKRFDERIEISLYRILQELLNNIVKHSGANQVSIQLFQSKNRLILVVEDNGKGFELKTSTSGYGLNNIKSRLNTIRGKVNYEPNEESGTVATISIPL